MSKISGYSNSVSSLGTDDLLDVSEKISSSPDVYESRKMTGAVLAAFIQTYAKNILENNGLTMTGNQTHDLNNLVLTFQNAGFAIEGAQTITSASAVADIFNLYDNTATLLHRFNNAYISLFGGGVPAGSEKLLINDKTKITDRLELSGTTDGFLMPRLTTAQMNAIASPTTNLLIYNTDLSSLYRYDGAAWVALSAGYGIIEIITDSDAGIPTFYADLQTALETCKTSGSNNVVKLHSDISLSAQIDINYSGTGTGNGYQFESLTIDFNGFEVSFDDAGTTNTFNINLQNATTSNQKLILLNGKISRTSGTGTHQALNMPATQYGTVRMSQMVIYCENSEAAEIAVTNGTGVNAQRNDFGGSVFISNASSSWATGFINGDNFKVISLGNANGLKVGGFGCRNVYIECKGSGVGASGGKLYDSYILTTTGDCVEGGGARIYNCQLFSTSGYIINDGSGTAEIYNSYGETGNSSALYAVNLVQNCTIVNDSSNATIVFPGSHRNSNFINNGSGKVADINFNVRIFDNCILISEGGVPVTTSGACQGILKNCTIKSNWNNASGHAMSLGHTSNTVYVANCILEVANASANCLYAASAKNAAVGNCGFKGATTAINANVTVALTAAPDANGNYEL